MEPVALAAADTTPFTKSISQASESSRQTLEETAVDIQTAYTNELDEIGVTADQTHNKIAISAESMWSRMTSAAEAGSKNHRSVSTYSGERPKHRKYNRFRRRKHTA